jgi:hypothetical protein
MWVVITMTLINRAEYGEHPEAAAGRMRWALAVATRPDMRSPAQPVAPEGNQKARRYPSTVTVISG